MFNKLFTKRKKSVTFINSINKIDGIDGIENLYDANNLSKYKDSLYLFIGVSMIRETISSIPLQLYKVINKDGDVEEIFDDPLIDLIERPNYLQTKKEFWKLAVSYYLLAGETFWYIQRDDAQGQIESMVNLRPDRVEILISQDKREIIGYEFRKGDGTSLKIAQEDVLHIKDVDPTNEVRGVGIIRPATPRIITEKEVSKHQAETFRSQGKPDIHVIVEEDLTQEMIDDGRERWHKNMQSQKGSKISFFGGNTREVKVQPATPKEMDFIASQKFLRDDILSAMRIPKAMVTSDDVNLANSKTARINYIKEACLPILDAFVDILNNKYLVDRDPTDDKFIDYDNPVIEDRELVLKEATELFKAQIIDKNEARSIMSYPDIDGGDEFYSNASPFQLSFQKSIRRKKALKVLGSRPVLKKKFKAVEAILKITEVPKEKSVKREKNPVFHSKEMKEKYIKTFNDKIDKKAETFKENIDAYNEQFLKRIIKYMEDFGINASKFFDVSTEIIEAKKIFVPLMEKMYRKQGQDVMNSVSVGFEKNAEQFYAVSSLLLELEQRSEFFIQSMLNTDFDQMKKIIVDGLEQGKGVAEIGKDLRGYFDNFSVSRAKTIARTETGRLISFATQEAYNQSEVVTGKQWLTAKDGKVRDNEGTTNDHTINEGVVVDTDGIFPNGEKYPGEKTINCRCAIAPTV